MTSIIFFFFLSFFSLATLPVKADSVQLLVNQSGQYRLSTEVEKWNETGVFVDQKAVKHYQLFSLAIANPGDKILVSEIKTITRLKPIFKKIEKVESEFIFFNDSLKTINQLSLSDEKESRSYMPILWVLAILLMFMANLFCMVGVRNNNALAFILAAISSLLSAIAIGFTVATLFPSVNLMSKAIAIVSFVAVMVAANIIANSLLFPSVTPLSRGFEKIKKGYKISSKIFYVLLGVIFILLCF